MNGAVSTLGQIATLQRADTPERLDRLERAPARLPGILRGLDRPAARGRREAGVTAPRVVAERTLGQVDRLLELPPEDSPVAVGARGRRARRDRGRAVAEAVQPSLAPFREVIVDDYLPASTETIGISALPGRRRRCTPRRSSGGPRCRSTRVRCTSVGVERLSSINEERRVLAAELGYPDRRNGDRRAHRLGREHRDQRPSNSSRSPRIRCAAAGTSPPRYFGRLPSANCEVRRVEEFREADEPMAFYYPPTDDGTRAGIYYINCYDLADRALHHVASVTYHEANPGHHFQLALQQEMPERPPLRRFGATWRRAAFAEGWGLYSERLADEMGLYLDGWERLGMLENQGLRAARLVTDSGIHALGLDARGQACRHARSRAGRRGPTRCIEIDRYIGMPGQALCYMTGMFEIQRARASESARLGAEFSLQRLPRSRAGARRGATAVVPPRVLDGVAAAPGAARACARPGTGTPGCPRSQSTSASSQHRARGEPLGHRRPRCASREPHVHRPERRADHALALELLPHIDETRRLAPGASISNGVAAACAADPPQTEHRERRRAPPGATSGTGAPGRR